MSTAAHINVVPFMLFVEFPVPKATLFLTIYIHKRFCSSNTLRILIEYEISKLDQIRKAFLNSMTL